METGFIFNKHLTATEEHGELWCMVSQTPVRPLERDSCLVMFRQHFYLMDRSTYTD